MTSAVVKSYSKVFLFYFPLSIYGICTKLDVLLELKKKKNFSLQNVQLAKWNESTVMLMHSLNKLFIPKVEKTKQKKNEMLKSEVKK